MRGVWRPWLLVALMLGGAPAAAPAQVFLASRPHPEFMIGPLFVRASVGPALDPVTFDIFWSLAIPPTRRAGDLEQDLYLLWPSAVTAEPAPADPALARYIEERGFTVIRAGRLPLFARSLFPVKAAAPSNRLAKGASFVTFIREGGPFGLTQPATYIRIPWVPEAVNRTWLIDLRMGVNGLVKPKRASWIEDLFWGKRHLLAISFNDVRPRAMFPLYFEQRERVVRLAEDLSELLVNFADADHLKIDEVFPRTSSRRLSESLESTEVVSLFLERSEGLTPQVLSVQFGYFSGLQAWTTILIPVLFFILGNAAGPLLTRLAARVGRTAKARIRLGPRDVPPARDTGVVLPRETLARIVPGETTYDELLRLCGPDAEERERFHVPERRTLVYRGHRVVPHWRRRLGWLATVGHWDVEDHEVEVELEGDRVRDVQAHVRRSRLAHPDAR